MNSIELLVYNFGQTKYLEEKGKRKHFVLFRNFRFKEPEKEGLGRLCYWEIREIFSAYHLSNAILTFKISRLNWFKSTYESFVEAKEI